MGPTNYPLSSALCSATCRRTTTRRWTPLSPFSQPNARHALKLRTPSSSYNPASPQLRELSAQHLRPSPHHHRYHQPLGLLQGLHKSLSPLLPPTPRAPRGPKSLGGPGRPPPSREKYP